MTKIGLTSSCSDSCHNLHTALVQFCTQHYCQSCTGHHYEFNAALSTIIVLTTATFQAL